MARVSSRKQYLFLCLLVLALAVVAAVPAAAEHNIDLSRLVVVGDSLSAGFQNGSLLASQQVNGYANLVGKQARTPLVLPLIADPGVPPVLELKSVNPLVIQRSTKPIPANPRLNPTEQATNLAVPGATVADVLNKVPLTATTIDFVLTNLILGLPGALAVPPVLKTQVQWAQALHPTTILLWIGNNDALEAATNGNANVTPVAEFEKSYKKLIDSLAETKATLVVANIPDVTAIPFLFSVPKLAAMFGVSPDVIMLRLGIGPGDFVTLDFLAQAGAIVKFGTGALPDNAVLTASEAAIVSQAVKAYNAIIARQAKRVGAALVDINGLFRGIGQHGFVVNGQRLTTNFLGGLFSLDGIHPTNTGYAIIANDFIKTMDRVFEADIPPLSVAKVAKTDPLVLPGVGHPASAMKPGDLDDMKKVLAH